MPTYIPIASYEVPSGSITTVTFSSIPQTYDDLLLSWSGKFTGGFWSAPADLRVNGLTTSIYNTQYVAASTGASGWSGASSSTAAYLYAAMTGTDATNTFSNSEMYFPNYTSTSYRKTGHYTSSAEANTVLNGTTYNTFGGVYFATTDAISSISVYYSTYNYTQPTTFYLYGIKNS